MQNNVSGGSRVRTGRRLRSMMSGGRIIRQASDDNEGQLTNSARISSAVKLWTDIIGLKVQPLCVAARSKVSTRDFHRLQPEHSRLSLRIISPAGTDRCSTNVTVVMCSWAPAVDTSVAIRGLGQSPLSNFNGREYDDKPNDPNEVSARL